MGAPTHQLEEGKPLHPVIWENQVNVSVNGTTLTKMGEYGWNAGMFSVNRLPKGVSGQIEHRIPEGGKDYFIGLARKDIGQSYEAIDFAWLINPKGAFIYLNGKYIELIEAKAGDVLQIEKEENTILFKKNNVAIAKFPFEEESDLFIDTSIKNAGTFEFTVKATFEAQFSLNRWRDMTGLTKTGNVFKKTLPNNWENAGFFSEGKIAKDKDGFIEHEIAQTNKYYMIGLSEKDEDQHYKTINFAWYVRGNTGVWLFKDGRSQVKLESKIGDKLRIERVGNRINMLKNNVIVRAYEADNGVDLHVDASLYNGNGSTYNLPLKTSFPDPFSSYLILKKKLDGGTPTIDGDLKFKFIQEYAVSSTQKINYKVYNWQRNAVLDADLSLQYGVNWFSVPTNALTHNEIYVLEVVGNKGQTYYLKFKYKHTQSWEEQSELEEPPSEG
jgi:hypothetical protein